jgi:hypothetical protein
MPINVKSLKVASIKGMCYEKEKASAIVKAITSVRCGK